MIKIGSSLLSGLFEGKEGDFVTTDKKPDKIESGIPGVELCPKCGEMTCFVLPTFVWDEDELVVSEYSCPKCKMKQVKDKTGIT